MEGLLILVLLVSVAQFCSSVSRPCSKYTSSLYATRHINEHHRHGYKLKLSAVHSYKVEKVNDDNCDIELQLDLLETTCHEVNPKNVEDCEIRSDREVMAKCHVTVTVTSGAPRVTEYTCDTKPVKTNEEIHRICPDCAALLALDDKKGLETIAEAVKKANKDHSHQHYYILHDVGRIQLGYMHTLGTGYWAEFALVETSCSRATRLIDACRPLCPAKPGHAFCKSSYTTGEGLGSVDCKFYPAPEESILYVNDYSDGPTTFAQLEEYRDERGHEMYVLNRAKPVLPPAPPAAMSTTTATNLGCLAPSDTSSHTLSSSSCGPGQNTTSPALAPPHNKQQQEVDIRTMRRMAGEGGEAEPVITSEAEGMFLNHTGLFMDSQIAYEIHC